VGLEIEIPFPMAKYSISMPNLNLASNITLKALNESNNSLGFLHKVGTLLKHNKHKIYKKTEETQVPKHSTEQTTPTYF